MISVEQLGMFAAELFLLQVDELAERHPQDRVGLHGGQAIDVGHAALVLEHRVKPSSPRARSIMLAGHCDAHQADLGLGLRLASRG